MNVLTRPPENPQARASDPAASAWVSANAGSGKTHVLVNRVIRLLLSGVEPSRILCLTFTRAAAAEMNRRLFAELSQWAILADGELDKRIADIGGGAAASELRERARRLFTLSLETPGGLKIQTLHAFSERLLQLFPVEAGLVPGFEIMDERTAAEMMIAARHSVFAEARAHPGDELGTALQTVAALAQAEKFGKLVDEILARRSQLGSLLSEKHARHAATAKLKTAFGIQQDADRDSIVAEILDVDRAFYAMLIDRLETPPAGKVNNRSAEVLRAVLAGEEAAEAKLRGLFLTKKPELCAPIMFMTQSLREAEPAMAAAFDGEQSRICNHFGRLAALEMIEATACLMTLSSRIIGEYEQGKRFRGAYDFDDLIHRTSALLRERPSAAWVLYKLDGGIDHILIDEAQDTSPSQWQIIKALAEEFFAGAGSAGDRPRSLFVVGDRKQSIFSFQGADPDEFDRVRAHFEARITAPERLRQVPLTVSHRSTPDILEVIDRVFACPGAAAGLNADIADGIEHETVRRGEAGLVELWPLAGKPAKEEPDPWTIPVDRLPNDHPSLVLADKIAATIKKWLTEGRMIESRRRPVTPGDILILVRSRNRFFDAVIRQLQVEGIKVAGADRVKLGEHIAVADLIALGEFVLLPEDDHALACLLKSPLIRHPEGRNFDDEDLFALAYARGGNSLWQRLCEKPDLDAIRQTLAHWMSLARTLAPYEFFAGILAEGRPSVRQRVLARLGHEANDLLAAFLDLALDYERVNSPSLQGFLNWFAAADIEIKRDMEQGGGEVRVMTVHGAKGLEANIVILPDTCAIPDGRTESNPMMISDGDSAAIPLWRLPNRLQADALARLRADASRRTMDEYRRQLYVAMTRARDELYVCGYTVNQQKPDCWYELVKQGMMTHQGVKTGDDGTLRVAGIQSVAPRDTVTKDGAMPSSPLPDWALLPVPPSASPPPARAPSRLIRRAVSSAAAKRGLAIHRLFQLLPDLPAVERQRAAGRLLARRGFSVTEAEEIAAPVLGLIEDPAYAPFFAPSTLAEIPFAARLPEPWGPISGQIDRLVVGGEEVFVLDFKTDRQPPTFPAGVSRAYLAQLAAYCAAVSRIFPDKSIRAAFLWTETPALMEIPTEALLRAFPPIT